MLFPVDLHPEGRIGLSAEQRQGYADAASPLSVLLPGCKAPAIGSQSGFHTFIALAVPAAGEGLPAAQVGHSGFPEGLAGSVPVHREYAEIPFAHIRALERQFHPILTGHGLLPPGGDTVGRGALPAVKAHRQRILRQRRPAAGRTASHGISPRPEERFHRRNSPPKGLLAALNPVVPFQNQSNDSVL